jgi:hypothetical protein
VLGHQRQALVLGRLLGQPPGLGLQHAQCRCDHRQCQHQHDQGQRRTPQRRLRTACQQPRGAALQLGSQGSGRQRGLFGLALHGQGRFRHEVGAAGLGMAAQRLGPVPQALAAVLPVRPCVDQALGFTATLGDHGGRELVELQGLAARLGQRLRQLGHRRFGRRRQGQQRRQSTDALHLRGILGRQATGLGDLRADVGEPLRLPGLPAGAGRDAQQGEVDRCTRAAPAGSQRRRRHVIRRWRWRRLGGIGRHGRLEPVAGPPLRYRRAGRWL